jgi:alcohol dehydrogenase class IV
MFDFHVKTKIVFGLNSVERLGAEIRAFDAHKVLLVTDKGIIQAGLLEKITRPLESADIEFAVFDEIEPNPKDTTILKGAQCMQDTQADVFIGLGGGSPMDAAKAIAVMAVNEEPIEQYCGVGTDPWPVPPKPVVAIPTTAGTGSEVSAAAMVNIVSKARKMDMFGRSIEPSVAILDPLLTVGLPPHLTAWTGIDALSHALEAYVAKYANPITDALAEKAIQLVADNLRQAYANGENLEARSNMLLASTMAVMAAAAGLGTVHSMAQTMGGYYDMPHGLSIAVCFPVGVLYNLFAAPEKYARVSQLLGTNTNGMNTIAAAKTVVPAIRELLDDVGVTDDMRSLGVREADIPELAEICMLDGCTPTNPRPIDVRGFAALFERSLN